LIEYNSRRNHGDNNCTPETHVDKTNIFVQVCRYWLSKEKE